MSQSRCLFVLLFIIACAIEQSLSFTSRHSCALHAQRVAHRVQSLPSPTVDSAQAQKPSSELRPLHQNWWPISFVDSLDPTRPNEVELLGMRLVLFLASEEEGWTCLSDRCSHRFAPLSEGRLVPTANGKSCLQCAYHGWEFNAEGACTFVPQRETSKGSVTPVPSYPVRRDVGIIWVWSDPSTVSLAESVALPISKLLRRQVAAHGDFSGFMRDLPYGMELLGENLLDLSHLPFSHHSLGNLDRELGGPLPLRMLSSSERQQRATLEDPASEARLPMFQAEVVNATIHDPIFLGMSKARGPAAIPEDSTCTISFFEPCHIRYRRITREGQATNVELFMRPTGAGTSRVFLFNVFEGLLPSQNDQPVKRTMREKLAALHPAAVMKKLVIAQIARQFNPASVRGHMVSHTIFDGDGIFLHKQGDRMQRLGLTYRDYSTPASADVLVNAYRRYLDTAANRATEAGAPLVGSTVLTPIYKDNLPRSVMLDRYNSHTKNCKICSTALEGFQKRRRRWEIASVALTGAAGASATALVGLMTAASLGVATVPSALLRIALMTSVLMTTGSWQAQRSQTNLDGQIQQFLFEDYIHAEKH